MKKKEKTQELEQWAASAWDMLYLVQCGINSVVPDWEHVAKMDLGKVYARCKSQSLEVLAYMALENLMKSNPKLQIPDEKQVLPQWKDKKNKTIAKNLMMDAAREQLFAFLENRGIWHMPLKGTVLCHMYPKYGMRQMTDNDILFDPSFRQEVHDWFVEQGYEVESFQRNNHDEYHKNPVYNFEMHVALFKESEQPQLAQYYRTIKEKLVQKPGTAFEYYMTDEDFYLYIIAHEYKHYCYAGIGLRFLLDIYVLNIVKNNLNRSYLDRELKKFGLLEFENETKKLALKLFAPDTNVPMLLGMLSEKEVFILKESISGSIYGTMQKYCNNQLRKMQSNENQILVGVKFRYLMRRLFPSRSYMEKWCQQYQPYFLRHRWLMPIALLWRIIKRGIKKRKQIKEEFDAVRKA